MAVGKKNYVGDVDFCWQIDLEKWMKDSLREEVQQLKK